MSLIAAHTILIIAAGAPFAALLGALTGERIFRHA